MEKSPQRAVFIDRDGTINEDAGYLARIDEVKIYPFAAEAIRLINDAGFKTIVVTNQSGVARGYASERDLDVIHEHLKRELWARGAHLDGVYYCPHHPDIGGPGYRKICDCRKPSPGMVQRAARDHNIVVASSYVIGDKVADLELGLRSGARPVLVLTGYGRITLERIAHADIKPVFVCENLLEAATRIVERSIAVEAESRS
jgi:D-glycero-D-manno-heptose 1,7-bisphosphate phosphatase